MAALSALQEAFPCEEEPAVVTTLRFDGSPHSASGT
jgi:hypothetical protein